jgi:arylsulfatase A-like enzyme
VSVVIVLSLDHWHAGLSGFCGGEPLLTTRLDGLASEAAVFDRHFAISPAGDPSINGRAWAGGGSGTGDALPETSAAERFERAGVSVEVLADARADWLELAGFESVRVMDGALEGAVAEAMDRLSETPQEHSLVWVAVSAPAEIQPAESGDEEDWFERLEAIDEAMGGFDRCVGAAVDGLERAGLSGEALLVVTGGRGAWLGDRGFEDDRRCVLHEERLRTPLVLRGPGVEPGQRRLELVQVTDLLPTLLVWFGADAIEDPLAGIDLLSLLGQGGRGGREEIVVRDSDGGCGLRTHELFLVRPAAGGLDASQLFSKPDDAWDLVDVSEQGPEEVERLSGRLDELLGVLDSGDTAVG